MRWGRRLRNIKQKVTGAYHRSGESGSRGRHGYNYNERRLDYGYSGDEYSDDSSRSYGEEGELDSVGSWEDQGDYNEPDYRDDVDDIDGADVNVDKDYPYHHEEYDSENELVTRDQVLGELRAQAAAEALGKSLEQMGYNLDNCDSFFSLSDKEEVDQRYNISQRASEASDRSKSGSHGKRKSKKKKRKGSKSPRSRYSAVSDEADDETGTYGDYSGRPHSMGDYETYASSSDESDSSYDDDSSSFTTGRTSGFSRFTGKKSGRSRKTSNSRNRKKHGQDRYRDHDTYYTEWTQGDSSYGKTLQANSTLSSVSNSDGSEIDSEYTEPSRRRVRALSNHRSRDRPKSQRRLKGMNEENKVSSPLRRNRAGQRSPKKSSPKKIRRPPCDVSSGSESSHIGAMRSLDTLSNDESPEADKKDKNQPQEKGETNEEKENAGPSSPQVAKKDRKQSKEGATDNEKKLSKDNNNPKKADVLSGDASDSPKDKTKTAAKEQKKKEKEIALKSDDGNRKHEEMGDAAVEQVKAEKQGSSASKKQRRTSKDPATDGGGEDGKDVSPKRSGKRASGSDADDVPKANGKPALGKKKGSKAENSKKNEKTKAAHRRGSDVPKKGPVKPSQQKAAKEQSDKKGSKGSKGSKDSSDQATLQSASKKFRPLHFLAMRKRKGDAEQDSSETAVKEEGKTSRTDKETSSKADQTILDEEAEQEKETGEEAAENSSDDKPQVQQLGKNHRRGKSSNEIHRNRDPRDSSDRDLPLQRSRLSEDDRKHPTTAKGREAAKETMMRELLDSNGGKAPGRKKGQEQQSKQNQSMGILEIAAMAAMIPLAAPIAAAYSCYTAESTQSMMKNSSCADCKTNEMPKKKGRVDMRRSKSEEDRGKKRRIKSSKKHLESILNSDDETHNSATNGSKKSGKSRSTGAKNTEATTEVDMSTTRQEESKSYNPTIDTGSSSRSKSSLTRVFPQRHGKPEPSIQTPTHIQEAPEGFESFLPDSVKGQCLSDSATLASEALTTIIPAQQPPRNVPSLLSPRRRGKKWMSKLNFGSHKRVDGPPPSVDIPDGNAGRVLQSTGEENFASPRKAPQKVPFLKPSKQAPSGLDNLTTNAMNSYWGPETPKSYMSPKMRGTPKGQRPPPTPDGGLAPFSCSKATTACMKGEDLDEGDIEMDHSLLSDFENLAIDALRKKSQQNEPSKENQVFDPSKATQEDLLKFYDLEQTLSDVIDARQTLETAYGLHSGGGSFDHTIDDQLVELLAHMAEMDQEDVVEIEAAIKKLKRHARKLGISERDLLFSVKSAEESALSVGDDELLNRNLPDEALPAQSFGEKVFGAFEGYFGKNNSNNR